MRFIKNSFKKIIGNERYAKMYIKRRIIDKDIRALVIKGYTESIRLSKSSESIEDYPIDFVVPWVDEKDPVWLADKKEHQKSLDQDNTKYNSAVRYRDWDMFEYWFRAVEKYAPWVNHVYLVTYGHIPSWLNIDHPKLRIVRHKDYIPKEYLPTFHSRPIELNLWRIPSLSEHFVYFNDDMFLMKPVNKEDFFKNGLPKLCSITIPQKPEKQMTSFDLSLYNSLGVYNATVDIRKVIEEHPEKWFPYQYLGDYDYNIRTYKDGYLSGMSFPHVCVPMRKSSIEACCRQFDKLIDSVCREKFRSHTNVNRQLLHIWELVHNTFEPVAGGHFGTFLNVKRESLSYLEKIANDSSKICLCVNDHEKIPQEDFEYIKIKVKEIFHKKFPDKSRFEV